MLNLIKSDFIDRRTVSQHVSFPKPTDTQASPAPPAPPKPLAPKPRPGGPKPPRPPKPNAPPKPRALYSWWYFWYRFGSWIYAGITLTLLTASWLFDASYARNRPIRELQRVSDLEGADPTFNYKIGQHYWRFNDRLRMWVDP